MSNDYEIYEPTYTHEQKDMKQHRFYIDDVIYVLMQMRKDGYRYASLDVIEECQDDDDSPYYACMFLTADDGGGYIGCDYEQVCEVPGEEIDEYAFRGKCKPPYRMAIEFSEIEAPEE